MGVSDLFQLMLLDEFNTVSSDHDPSRKKRSRRSFLFSSRIALRSARMTRAKKQLPKRCAIGSRKLRKLVCFDGRVHGQSDFHAIQNARLADEDLL